MDYVPGQFLANPEDPETLKTFLDSATTGTTSDINGTQVEAEIYLTRTLAGASREIGSALTTSAEALRETAEASSRHAASLARATWALVLATSVLALLALLQLFVR